ncbi:MAG: C45 family autoproteolytic acyltransferase/hydrolase [Planctomycetota bacterium]|jgi:hypothetical protein
MVKFIGAPEEVGIKLGEILAPFIRARVEGYLNDARGDRAEAQVKAQTLLGLLHGEVPHWIEEYRGVSKAAGVDFETLLEVNCAAPLTSQPSCTSVLALGSRTARGFPLLLKIRDERPQHQAMGYRRIEGTHGMLFGVDACNLGVGQGCNEHGLAVANNSGGLVPESPEPMGFNDCQMTRLLLERAGSTDEALEVLRDLLERGKVGLVDGVRGMIFLIADPKGKGLIIEATRDKFEFQEMDDGLAVWSNHWLLPGSERFTKPLDPEHPLCKSSVLRLERGLELLEDKDKISALDLESVSRDEANAPYSICNGSEVFPWRTVSSFVYELDPELSLPVRAAPGLPTHVHYRDVPLWSDDTPVDYLLEWTP